MEQDDARRGQLRAAFTSRGVPVYEVADAVDAMVALGRANFGALLASEGKRHLSLRGLCLLARRRHPGIRLVVLAQDDVVEEVLRERLGIDVDLLPQDVQAREVVDAVLAFAPALLSPFDMPIATEVLRSPPAFSDDAPKTDSGSAPSWHAPEPAGGASLKAASERWSSAVEPTARMVPALREEFGEPTLIDQPTEMDVPSLDDVVPLSAGAPSLHPIAAARERARVMDPTLVAPRQVGRDTSLATQGGADPALVDHARRPRPVSSLPTFVEPADTQPTSGATLRGLNVLSENVVLEGALEDVRGPPLLMGVFAQELTGRLELALPSGHSTLYFHVGEPVGAAHPMGDAGLYEALFARGVLTGRRHRPAVPEGELLSALVESGALTGDQLHELLRSWLEERLDELLSATSGTYRFVESVAFLQTLPLCRVDPFSIIRRFYRRRLESELFVEAVRVGEQWIVPAASLAVCGPRIVSFSGGQDLSALVGDGAPVKKVIDAVRLDDLEGTLLVLTLEAARLVELVDLPRAHAYDTPGMVTLDTAPTVEVPRIPDADDSGDRSADQEALREEIFALYMRLKPLTRPSQVLGVPLGATLYEVERAYQTRMKMLDPRRVQPGPSGDLLRSRIDELRTKLTHAYEAVRLQLEATGKIAPARGGKKGEPNPW